MLDSPYSIDFSRENRLVQQSDFQSVFAGARKITHKHLIVLAKPSLLPNARLGMIIAKQHIKKAVDRNQIRRILRESFRQHKEILKGLDIIVLLRSKWSPLDKKVLRKDSDYLWQALAKSSVSL